MRREKLIVVNPSCDDEYHSQINNKEVPHGACNVTAYVMSGKQAGPWARCPSRRRRRQKRCVPT